MKILIIGGTGAFGTFYADLFKKNGFEVGIQSRDTQKALELSKEKGYLLSNNPKDFDIVILSTPNEATPKIVHEIIPALNKGTLLIDFCSVKTLVVKAMQENLARYPDLEMISIHPMHGPRVENISGFPIVFIPVNIKEKYLVIKSFFEKESGNIIETTAENHDKTLSIVQGLTHYAQFVSAAVIKELEVDLKETMKFSSPNYSLFLSLLSRVTLQNPELYAQIQLENPHNAKVRELFSKNALRIEEICKKEKYSSLTKEIILNSQTLKDPDVLLIESDRMVNAQKYIINIIKNHIGKKFLVENLLTKKFHYGIIKGVNSNELILLDGVRETHLSLQKIRITTKEEMLAWEKNNLEKKALDFSFFVPQNTDSKIIQKILLLGGVEFELIEEYSKQTPADKKSLTFRANYYDDEKKKEIIEYMSKLTKGLGFEMR